MKFIFSVICLSLVFPLFPEKKMADFTILTFNDVYDIHPKVSGMGGFATLQTMLNKERERAKNHITTMNGDFLFPSILSTFDRGKHRVELFNALKVDMVVLGNHEFDFGPDIVKQRISESNFLWFGANTYDLNGKYFTGEKQTMIREIDGVKIGFFGIVTNETPILSSCENKVLFCPLTLTAKRMCKELKSQGAEVIVALTHLFVSEDRQLAKEVPEIDVILGGHDHDPIMWYENDTLIMKTGQNAYFLGRINLHIEIEETTEEKVVNVFPSWKIILNRDKQPDERVQVMVELYDKNFEEIGQTPIAFTESFLDSRHSVVRRKESTMANLILDALKEELGAECAMMSGGILRGDRLYTPGTGLSYKDIMSELAFDNKNILLKVKGIDILKALENGVSQCEDLAGRFPQVSGMEVFFNENNRPEERIIEVLINGEALDLKRYYTLATNTYNASGGDGFYSLCNAHIILTPEEAGKLIDTTVDYLKKNPKISAAEEGRIKLISSVNSLDFNNARSK